MVGERGDDRPDCWIAVSAEHQFLDNHEQIGSLKAVKSGVCKFLTETVECSTAGWRNRRCMQANKERSEILRQSSDQRLLGREIIVQRSDVDAGPIGNAARPQPFK